MYNLIFPYDTTDKSFTIDAYEFNVPVLLFKNGPLFVNVLPKLLLTVRLLVNEPVSLLFNVPVEEIVP